MIGVPTRSNLVHIPFASILLCDPWRRPAPVPVAEAASSRWWRRALSRVAVVGKGIHPGNGFIFGVPLGDLAKRCVALEEDFLRGYSRTAVSDALGGSDWYLLRIP